MYEIGINAKLELMHGMSDCRYNTSFSNSFPQVLRLLQVEIDMEEKIVLTIVVAFFSVMKESHHLVPVPVCRFTANQLNRITEKCCRISSSILNY